MPVKVDWNVQELKQDFLLFLFLKNSADFRVEVNYFDFLVDHDDAVLKLLENLENSVLRGGEDRGGQSLVVREQVLLRVLILLAETRNLVKALARVHETESEEENNQVRKHIQSNLQHRVWKYQKNAQQKRR